MRRSSGAEYGVDFRDDPVSEFFYRRKGDMILKVVDEGEIRDVRINQGEVFILPPLYVSFYADETQPTCDRYGAIYPG